MKPSFPLAPDPAYTRVYLPLIRLLVGLIYRAFGGYSIQGVENIPRQGRALVACNHLSLADPLAMLVASPRALFYMAAQELHELPWLDPCIRFLQSFPVRRGELDAEALGRARALLRNEQAVVVYPEGGISLQGWLQPFYPGVAVLALREHAPIVPAVIAGTDRMLPVGARMLRPGRKSIRFGPPLPCRLTPGVSVKEQVRDVLARLRAAMLELGAVPGPEDRKSLPG